MKFWGLDIIPDCYTWWLQSALNEPSRDAPGLCTIRLIKKTDNSEPDNVYELSELPWGVTVVDVLRGLQSITTSVKFGIYCSTSFEPIDSQKHSVFSLLTQHWSACRLVINELLLTVWGSTPHMITTAYAQLLSQRTDLKRPNKIKI